MYEIKDKSEIACNRFIEDENDIKNNEKEDEQMLEKRNTNQNCLIIDDIEEKMIDMRKTIGDFPNNEPKIRKYSSLNFDPQKSKDNILEKIFENNPNENNNLNKNNNNNDEEELLEKDVRKKKKIELFYEPPRRKGVSFKYSELKSTESLNLRGMIFQKIKKSNQKKRNVIFNKKRIEILVKFTIHVTSNIFNILAVLNYIVQTFFDDSPENEQINLYLTYIELSLTFYFLFEYIFFFYRLKGSYIKYFIKIDSFIDMITIIPSIITYFISFRGVKLSFIRVFRIFRVFRILRIYKSLRMLQNETNTEKENGENNGSILAKYDPIKLQFITIVVILVCVFFIGAGLVLGINDLVENAFTIKKFNFFDATYFMIVTYCTLGYGDIFPTSNITRFLIIMGLFSLFVIVSDQLTRLANLLKFWGPGIRQFFGKNHIIILADKTINLSIFLKILTKSSEEKTQYIIISKDIQQFPRNASEFKRVKIINRDDIDYDLLDLINLRHAKAIFLFSTKSNYSYERYDKISDFFLMKITQISYSKPQIYLQTLNAEKILQKQMIFPKINNFEDKNFLSLKKVIPIWKIKSLIISKSTFNPGFPTFIQNLMFNDYKIPITMENYSQVLQNYMLGCENKIRLCKLPNFFTGKDFYDAMYIIYFKSINDYFVKVSIDNIYNNRPVLLLGVYEINKFHIVENNFIEIFPNDYLINEDSYGIFITYSDDNYIEKILSYFNEDYEKRVRKKLKDYSYSLNSSSNSFYSNLSKQELSNGLLNIEANKVYDSNNQKTNKIQEIFNNNDDNKDNNLNFPYKFNRLNSFDYHQIPSIKKQYSESNNFVYNFDQKFLDHKNNSSGNFPFKNFMEDNKIHRNKQDCLFVNNINGRDRNNLNFPSRSFCSSLYRSNNSKNIYNNINQEIEEEENENMTYESRSEAKMDNKLSERSDSNESQKKIIIEDYKTNIRTEHNKPLDKEQKYPSKSCFRIRTFDDLINKRENEQTEKLNKSVDYTDRISKIHRNSNFRVHKKFKMKNNRLLFSSGKSVKFLTDNNNRLELDSSSEKSIKNPSENNNELLNIKKVESLELDLKKDLISKNNLSKFYLQEKNIDTLIMKIPSNIEKITNQASTDLIKFESGNIFSNDKEISNKNYFDTNNEDEYLNLRNFNSNYDVTSKPIKLPMKDAENQKYNLNFLDANNIHINNLKENYDREMFKGENIFNKNLLNKPHSLNIDNKKNIIFNKFQSEKISENSFINFYKNQKNMFRSYQEEKIDNFKYQEVIDKFTGLVKRPGKHSSYNTELINNIKKSYKKNTQFNANASFIRSSSALLNFYELGFVNDNNFRNKNTMKNLEFINDGDEAQRTINIDKSITNQKLNSKAVKFYFNLKEEENMTRTKKQFKKSRNTKLIEFNIFELEKHDLSKRFKNHIIIIGYQDILSKLLKIFFIHHSRDICIISSPDSDEVNILKLLRQYDNLFFLKGSPENPFHLLNAGLNNAYLVLFLNEKLFGKTNEDMHKILIYKSMDYFFNTRMILELWDSKSCRLIGNVPLLDNAEVETNEFLHPSYMAGRLIYLSHLEAVTAKSFTEPDSTDIWINLLSLGLRTKVGEKGKHTICNNSDGMGMPVILTLEIPEIYYDKEYYLLVDDLMKLNPPA